MNRTLQIIISIVGIIILVLMIFLIFDLAKASKFNISNIGPLLNTFIKSIKLGFHRIFYSSSLKMSSNLQSNTKDIIDTTSEIPEKIDDSVENIYSTTVEGQDIILDSTTIPLSKQINKSIEESIDTTKIKLNKIDKTKNKTIAGAKTVMNVSTGEITNNIDIFTQEIKKLNNKINQGLDDLKTDIFHVHNKIDKIDNKSESESNNNEKDTSKSQRTPNQSEKNASKSENEENIKKKKQKKEVFNINKNLFTYEDAPLVCKAYGAELASYDQVLNSYKKGANWCNYGWSQDQMALYPIQDKFYDTLQKGPESHRDDCGKPGINGGYFKDKDLKFGVNCYGVKPKIDYNKVKIVDDSYKDGTLLIDGEPVYHLDSLNIKLDEIKKTIKKNKVSTLPWNENKWSKSSKESNKMIIPINNHISDEIDNTISECNQTKYGCCADGTTTQIDADGTNCNNQENCDNIPLSEYITTTEVLE